MEPHGTDTLKTKTTQLPLGKENRSPDRESGEYRRSGTVEPSSTTPRLYPRFDCIFLLSVVGEAAAHVGNRMLL